LKPVDKVTDQEFAELGMINDRRDA